MVIAAKSRMPARFPPRFLATNAQAEEILSPFAGSETVVAYQTDFVKFHYLVEQGDAVETAFEGAKTAVEDYHAMYGQFPKDNEQAGIADPQDIFGKYTEEVLIRGDRIEVRFEYDSHVAIYGEQIELHATNNNGSLSWICGGDGIEINHLPSSCRDDVGGKKKKKKD